MESIFQVGVGPKCKSYNVFKKPFIVDGACSARFGLSSHSRVRELRSNARGECSPSSEQPVCLLLLLANAFSLIKTRATPEQQNAVPRIHFSYLMFGVELRRLANLCFTSSCGPQPVHAPINARLPHSLPILAIREFWLWLPVRIAWN